MSAEDIRIQELVDKIGRNEIRLPEMQRQYVWKQTQVRDLLDSLYRGYPSGSILTWQADEDFGSRDFAVDQKEAKKQQFEYLLDGQQRLTSLYSLLRGELVTVRNRKKPIDILFNLDHPDMLEESINAINDDMLEEESDDEDVDEDVGAEANESELMQRFKKMTFVVYNKKLANQPGWVSVTDAFKEENRNEILERMGIKMLSDPRNKKYSDRLVRLCKIKDYTYRVHKLEKQKSYAEVTDIFVRVNSLGAKLRSSDLALAQITAKWKGSLQIFESFEKECKQRGFDFGGLDVILRTLVAFATKQALFDSVSKLPEKKLKDSWAETKEGMYYALNFLHDDAKIESRALMSSPSLVPVIALYGRTKENISSQESVALKRWALMASAKGRYSRGSSETILNEDLAVIRDNEGITGLMSRLKRQFGRLEVVADDLAHKNKNSPYFKTMFLAFRAAGARDWHKNIPISINSAGAKHALQAHHLFPRALLERKETNKKQINDICNFAFISGKANRKIGARKPEEYLPEFVDELGEDELKKQCIPTNRALWKVDAYDDFLAERRELIAKRLNEFLNQE